MLTLETAYSWGARCCFSQVLLVILVMGEELVVLIQVEETWKASLMTVAQEELECFIDKKGYHKTH